MCWFPGVPAGLPGSCAVPEIRVPTIHDDQFRGSDEGLGETATLVNRALGLQISSSRRSVISVLGRLGLIGLSRAPGEEIALETDLSAAECDRLAAVFELGRRVEEQRWFTGDSVCSSAGVYRLMAPKLRGIRKETFYVLHLDGRHRLSGCQRVSEGTLTTSLVHPREVFVQAIREGAAAIIVAHNHPSGDPEPSQQDFEVTRRLARCGRMVGIPLLDHVVIGHGAHVSIRERIEF